MELQRDTNVSIEHTALKMEVLCSSETSAHTPNGTRRNNPDDTHLLANLFRLASKYPRKSNRYLGLYVKWQPNARLS